MQLNDFLLEHTQHTCRMASGLYLIRASVHHYSCFMCCLIQSKSPDPLAISWIIIIVRGKSSPVLGQIPLSTKIHISPIPPISSYTPSWGRWDKLDANTGVYAYKWSMHEVRGVHLDGFSETRLYRQMLTEVVWCSISMRRDKQEIEQGRKPSKNCCFT